MREEEGSPDRQIFRRGFDDKKIKGTDRLYDLKKILNSLLRSLRGPPLIALQSNICKMKFLGEYLNDLYLYQMNHQT